MDFLVTKMCGSGDEEEDEEKNKDIEEVEAGPCLPSFSFKADPRPAHEREL